jgi:hypothetical protein
MILIVDDYLFLAGGLIALLWGVAHLFLGKPAARAWLAEGIGLVLIGGLVISVVAAAGTENDGVRIMTWLAGAAMFGLAAIDFIRGRRGSLAPFKAGAVINAVSGALFIIGSIINS